MPGDFKLMLAARPVKFCVCVLRGRPFIWSYPDFKSMDKKLVARYHNRVSSILGSGCLFLTVRLFSARRSQATRFSPVGFAMNLTGAPKG